MAYTTLATGIIPFMIKASLSKNSSTRKKCSACTACNEGTCGSITLEDPVEGMTLTNDTYYLYIEISPLIDAFGMQENILDYFVPSYMLFDLKFDIEIG